MGQTTKEIYNTLETNPEIKKLIDLVLSLPESRQKEAVDLAVDLFRKLR